MNSSLHEIREVPSQSEPLHHTISLQNVTKGFRRRSVSSGYSTIKSALLSCFRSSKREPIPETTALRNLTMRVPKGASLGVIGRNGSGKSTLLKLITGIYQPSSGTVQCSGRVSALIELGAGFHPDFTGRENIFLGGMIQGLSKRDIQERFDEIVEFAELAHCIDEP
ncbi:ATP-binding cassette domain-containing protein, partial [bacterium]|nr:ATP-binding cassette domain-containing protein [bacterium]